MSAQLQVQYVSDEEGQDVSVIVPMCHSALEIASEGAAKLYLTCIVY